MKLRTLSLGIILSFFSITAMAGSGHDHGHFNVPVNMSTARTNATNIVKSLIKRNKLDKSWGSITSSLVEKKTYEGKQEWEVTFVNDKTIDPAKKTLYVFLTLGGDYIAANHTGK